MNPLSVVDVHIPLPAADAPEDYALRPAARATETVRKTLEDD
ncbi:MAG: hypothetical protein ACLP3Q_10780 [Streptosporangiaceae bacterium]